MRLWIYQLLMWLVWPLWVIYTIKRCRHQGNALECWQQLWTIKRPRFSSAPIWIHAVSLGETQAAFILIDHLRNAYPHQPIFFTGGNSSAINAARQKDLTGVSISFLPLDFMWLRRRLFDAVQPKLLILMETEFWPNLLNTAHQRHIPVAIVQARLSLSSRRNYPKYGQPLLKQLLAPVAFVAAQTQSDAQALIHLGVRSQVCYLLGNIKYDFKVAPELVLQGYNLSQRFGQRWVWTAGSTHPGEELALIQAHRQLTDTINNPLLVLVPRHPDYFNSLAEFLQNHHISFIRWSEWFDKADYLPASAQVLLVDTLGRLMLCYQVAEVCFVGGSLVPWGGHNLLEPAALAKAIVTGAHNHNFSEIEQGLISVNGMRKVMDATDLAQWLIECHQHPALKNQMGYSAQSYFNQQQGATQKIVNQLKKYIAN